MHDELISMEIPQKMLELSAIAFSPMKSINISMKRKFNSNGHHYRSHLTSASSDISNEEHPNCEDDEDDSRISSTLIDNGDLISAESKLATDINLPSPPSSTRSSFENDGVTRDSFITNGDQESITESGAIYDSFSPPTNNDIDVILEKNHEEEPKELLCNDDSFEDDIKLLTEDLVKMVSDEFESAKRTPSELDIEELWKDIEINIEGETILPNGLRLKNGVADMPFIQTGQTEPSRFTNQLNFLKMIMTKYICRYKTAMPFLHPVNSVQLKIPHYYRVIRKPMDLSTVKNRINFLWYRTAHECISDLRLIFSNCYQFNSPTDYVYKAGKKLEEYLDEKLKEMPPKEIELPLPEIPSIEEVQKQCQKKIPPHRSDSISEHSENNEKTILPIGCAVKMTTRSERGVMVRKPSKDLPAPISTPQPKTPTPKRVPLNESMKFCHEFVKELFNKKHAEYAWPFWEPVNTEQYPDYLQKIKRPIDLSTIKVKIETGKYVTVNDFASDMRLMFSNCLRYNKPESPVIEQARKLREVFEHHYARIPEEWLHEKLVIPQSSNGRAIIPSVRLISASGSSSKHLAVESHQKITLNKNKAASKQPSESKKTSKSRNSTPNNSGHTHNITPRLNGASLNSTKFGGESSRMEQLERQVANLTNALQQCLVNGITPDQSALTRTALINAMMPKSVANGKTSKGRPRKNGLETKPNSGKKTAKKQTTSRKRKRHLSSDEESDSDEQSGQVGGGLAESFDPETISDLKKLKDDLENLRAKDLQNVLRILQSTEPSLRCDDESNVEIDFEKLNPKTLIALRKYVTSCMLNAKSSSPSNSAALTSPMASTNSAANNSNNKRFCHSNSLRSVSNLDTDCDNSTINNWSRAGSRASDLQLSESSSSDSELDD